MSTSALVTSSTSSSSLASRRNSFLPSGVSHLGGFTLSVPVRRRSSAFSRRWRSSLAIFSGSTLWALPVGASPHLPYPDSPKGQFVPGVARLSRRPPRNFPIPYPLNPVYTPLSVSPRTLATTHRQDGATSQAGGPSARRWQSSSASSAGTSSTTTLARRRLASASLSCFLAPVVMTHARFTSLGRSRRRITASLASATKGSSSSGLSYQSRPLRAMYQRVYVKDEVAAHSMLTDVARLAASRRAADYRDLCSPGHLTLAGVQAVMAVSAQADQIVSAAAACSSPL